MHIYSIYFLLSSLWSKLGIQLGLDKQKSQTIYSRIIQSSQVPTETYWVKLSMLIKRNLGNASLHEGQEDQRREGVAERQE